MKTFFKKITAFVWAFIALIAVFFTAGMFTLGSVNHTGESFLVETGKVAYFSLNLKSGEKLGGVYVNVGTVYAEAEETITLSLKTSASSSPTSDTTSSWPASGKTSVSFSNFTTNEQGKTDGVNYNWVPLATDINKLILTIGFSASDDLELNEIVCLNTNGEQIPLKVSTSMYKNETNKSYGTAADVEALAAVLDAQESFNSNENAYYNFTAEESYYLASVETLFSGSSLMTEGTYPFNENFNYLATVLLAPTVAMFGNSTFALRLPAFIATCALIVFAYLLVRELTKNDKISFVFAVILCLGGMATTVGRIGAPYVMIAAALVMSAYFMYRFYAKGISSDRIICGGLNILLSGIAAAFALAMDALAIFPVLAILVLFGFGLRRQKLAYNLALAKTEGKEEEVETEDGEKITVNTQAKEVKAQYNEKNRISYGFAALGFLMGTIVLLIVSAILCYNAYIKVNGVDSGFLTTLGGGIKNSLLGNAFVPYASANSGNVWTWLLPWSAATVYTGVNGIEAGKYLAWNVAPNTIATCFSAVSLLAVLIKVAYDIVKKNNDKKALRLRRGMIVLLGGMAATMIAGAIKGETSLLYAMAFHTLYLAFIPLAMMFLFDGEESSKTGKIFTNAVMVAMVVAVATVFVLSIPSMYGIMISAEQAKTFGWTIFVNNGYFR